MIINTHEIHKLRDAILHFFVQLNKAARIPSKVMKIEVCFTQQPC